MTPTKRFLIACILGVAFAAAGWEGYAAWRGAQTKVVVHEAYTLCMSVQKYRKDHGEFPASSADVANLLPKGIGLDVEYERKSSEAFALGLRKNAGWASPQRLVPAVRCEGTMIASDIEFKRTCGCDMGRK
jgi:hypothetical protein